MKTKIRQWQKRITIAVLLAMVFLLSSPAQKSHAFSYDDINLEHLKSLINEKTGGESGLIALWVTQIKNRGNMVVNEVMLKNEIEEHIKVEPWMLNESHFTGTISDKPAINEQFEEHIPVETWMLDETHFMPKKKTMDFLPEEKEESIKVEDWMLDTTHFNVTETKYLSNRITR